MIIQPNHPVQRPHQCSSPAQKPSPPNNLSSTTSAIYYHENSGWISRAINSVLDSCSTLFRFLTGLVWRPKPGDFLSFEIPQPKPEELQALEKEVSSHAKKAMLEFRTASHTQIAKLLYVFTSTQAAIFEHNQNSAGNELISARAIIKRGDKTFSLNLDTLSTEKQFLIERLNTMNTSILGGKELQIEFAFGRITKPAIGPLVVDSSSVVKTYSRQWDEVSSTTNQESAKTFFYSDISAQAHLVELLLEDTTESS